ncbi:MAG: HEAT repeat protein [Planctomycetota bacterium]|jgi:HEAT repeat protein
MMKFIHPGFFLAAGALILSSLTLADPLDTVPPTVRGPASGPQASRPKPAPAPGGARPTSEAPRSSRRGVGGAVPGDFTRWEAWWSFNSEEFLGFSSRGEGEDAAVGSGDYFISRGELQAAARGNLPSKKTIGEVILPALSDVLTGEKSDVIVQSAILALARVAGNAAPEDISEVEPLLLQMLNSDNQGVVDTAVVALGILSKSESIDLLKAILSDDPMGRKLLGAEGGVSVRTRAFAAFSLGQIGNHKENASRREEIVEALWLTCELPRQATRDLRVAAVMAMGLVPLEIDTSVAFHVSHASRAPRNRSEQIAYLLDFFTSSKDRDRPELVRAFAPNSICNLLQGVADESIKQQVVALFAPYVTKRGNVGTRELRQSVVTAFGLLGDLDGDSEDILVRERLMDASRNSDTLVKHLCVMALGRIGGRPGQGMDALAGLSSVREFLTDSLFDGQTQLRPWAGLAIGVMEGGLIRKSLAPSSYSLKALRSALRDARGSSEQAAYSLACGLAGDLDAEALLLETFEQLSDDYVRGYAALALGMMKSDRARVVLRTELEGAEYHEALLENCAMALGMLRDAEAVGSLILMLAKAKSSTTQASIAYALGLIGDEHSVDPLVAVLKNTSLADLPRSSAAIALGIVGDGDRLPWNAIYAANINYSATTETLSNGAGSGLLDMQ